MPDIDPQLAETAKQIEQDGVTRFGKENWGTYVSALSKVLPKGTDPANVIRGVASTDDPAGSFAKAGRESLLALAGSDDLRVAREASDAYQSIRQAEKEKHRAARGRR